ncbi:MAG TPA: hypothetical protein VI895_08105 [Bdellovibrionota bacterium]|nr:hypothetical protein [Bdellovibrionota bacterium]
MKAQPPRLKGIQYRWCQPLTEKQLRQREKLGMDFNREVGREEGERRYGNRVGRWTFWDKDGKKMAEGSCDAPPPLRESKENGTWSYWDPDGRKIDMNWKLGIFGGNWTLFDHQGIKRWQFQLKDREPKKELFADENYLRAEGLEKYRIDKASRKNPND